jgi:DNA-binding PadR family transcriptional regulator
MSLERILLGLLREPGSGYDLKNLFDRTIRYFWAAELSQIYPTLHRLLKRGWVRRRVAVSARGPDRKVYSLTGAGREALREWVADEPKFGDERFAYVAQLFFMWELGDFDRTLSFAKTLRTRFADRLAELHEIKRARFESDASSAEQLSDDEFHQYLTLELGLRTIGARLEWCDWVIAAIEKRTAAEPQTDGATNRRRK